MGSNPRIVFRGPGFEAEAELFADRAPKTVAALLKQLPFRDRTIQTRWSGDAWRTEGNHELLTPDDEVEAVADRLGPGDVIYYPGYRSNLLKIGVAYGDAKWLAPFCRPIDVSLIGHIDTGLDDFVRVCSRIIFEGPLSVEIAAVP